jgi:hypothetical protein
VPALVGRVPDDVVRCVVALLDFTYMARLNSHTSITLEAMEQALERFQRYRNVFEALGVRDNGFSLPRQHALVHYVDGIRDFGSPNGLCSSITESKHIEAVKKPWRRSGRNGHALISMLKINTRLHKLTSARVEFGRRGLLSRTLDQEAERTAAALASGYMGDDLDNFEISDLDTSDDEDDAEERLQRQHYYDVRDAPEPRQDDYKVALSVKPSAYSFLSLGA